MRNAKERNELLGQIAELEQGSINYFDVEEEFFLIDSENLSEVQTRFYGYSIQADGIYEEDNLTPEAVEGLDGRGCYVYVEARDGQITIKQDLNGSWGIYLFRHDDYFALSNSFFRLLDHVKFRYPLTVNRDYCHHLLINSLCSQAYSKTAVNEVQLVERNAILHIDTAEKNLQIELIDYHENSVPLDSKEGMAILDSWFDLWVGVLRGVRQHTKFLSADLSGGIDTRANLVPLLHSGIDCNDMNINSITKKSPVYVQDYAIASQIAEHYGFELNRPFPDEEFLNYSLTDIFNLDFYHRQTTHKDSAFASVTQSSTQKSVEKHYVIKGFGGKALRDYWCGLPKIFIEEETRRARNYSPNLSAELSHSVENIIASAFRAICGKYKIKNPNSIDIPQYLYQETRCRNHFGKLLVGYYFQNVRVLSPALDPLVRTLRLNTDECSDINLLMFLFFLRYEPALLEFPFEGKRSFNLNTIDFARKLNERFPRLLITEDKADLAEFNLQTHDTRTAEVLASGHNNAEIPNEIFTKYLKAAFDSGKSYTLFNTYFSGELYNDAASHYGKNIKNPVERIRRLYPVLGIVKVLEDMEISNAHRPFCQSVRHFIEEDFCEINDDAQIINKFSNYFTARIDLKLITGIAGDVFQILSVSDNRAVVTRPEWLQKGGVGYVIRSYAGQLTIVAKTAISGKMQISLLGRDIRDKEDKSKRIPYWIDYTRMTINGKIVLGKIHPAWHDEPCRRTVDVNMDEEITIQVEWLPHRSNT